MTSVFAKIRALLTRSDRKNALVLLGLMVVGMALKTRCAGLVIPAIALMTQQDLATIYPQFQPLLAALRNPTRKLFWVPIE